MGEDSAYVLMVSHRGYERLGKMSGHHMQREYIHDVGYI